MYQSSSMFLPPWRHATYKGQTNEYGIQVYVYALLHLIKYVPISLYEMIEHENKVYEICQRHVEQAGINF